MTCRCDSYMVGSMETLSTLCGSLNNDCALEVKLCVMRQVMIGWGSHQQELQARGA